MNEHMISLAAYESELEAEIARGHLESAGIDAIVSKDDAGGMLPSLHEAEGVRVLVWSEDVRRARVVLREKSITGQPS